MVTTDPSSQAWSAGTHRVYRRVSWADPWVDLGPMKNMQVTKSLGNTIGRATWTSYRGNIASGDGAPAVSGWQFDLDLGAWVKIVFTPEFDGDVTPSPISWYGVLTDATLEEMGSNAINYDVTAMSLEWLLTRHQLTNSTVELLAGATTKEIGEAITFNRYASDGTGATVIQGNMSTVDSLEGVRVFASTLDNPATWTAKDIVQYLLQYYAPGVNDANHPTWELDISGGADNVLAWHKPQVEAHGETLYSLINRLIMRQRGITWRIEVNEGSNLIQIKLASAVPTAVSLPGGVTIPANPNLKTLDVLEQEHVDSSTTVVSHQRTYSSVCVTGAKVGAVFTVKMDEEIVPDWDSAERTKYASGLTLDAGYAALAFEEKAMLNDNLRMGPEFDHVYTNFKLKDDWDGIANGERVLPNIGEEIVDDFDASGGSYPDGSGYSVGDYFTVETAGTIESEVWGVGQRGYWTGSEFSKTPPIDGEFWQAALRFEDYLPWRKGYKYEDPTAPTQDVDGAEGLYRPWVLARLVNLNYAWVDKLSSAAFSEQFNAGVNFSCHVSTMKDKAGLIVSPTGAPHLIAEGSFDPDAAEPTDQMPLLDYRTIEATVFMRFPSYCSGSWPPVGAATFTDQESTHCIQIGDRAQYIYQPEGTIVGLEGLGELQRSTTAGAIRDDRQLCEDLARAAFEYYGYDRRAIRVGLRMLSGHVGLGDLITTHDGTTVNAIVSAITWTFGDAPTTIISTDYVELDFASLI